VGDSKTLNLWSLGQQRTQAMDQQREQQRHHTPPDLCELIRAGTPYPQS
jgi:hypothetical protein